jgi:hypothetical protein
MIKKKNSLLEVDRILSVWRGFQVDNDHAQVDCLLFRAHHLRTKEFIVACATSIAIVMP